MKWLAPVLVAALFVVVSCASSAETSGGSAESTSALETSKARPDFVGYSWRLAHVTTGGLSFDVHPLSPSDPPLIQFTSGGQYGASDGINYTSGTYALTKSGFEARFGATTLVGYAGTDRDETAVIDAIGDLVGQIPVTVSASSSSDTITMTVKSYELTFRRDGDAITDAPEPSSTGPVPRVLYGTPPNCDLSTAPENLPCPGDSFGPS
jgi:hypothetical protein